MLPFASCTCHARSCHTSKLSKCSEHSTHVSAIFCYCFAAYRLQSAASTQGIAMSWIMFMALKLHSAVSMAIQGMPSRGSPSRFWRARACAEEPTRKLRPSVCDLGLADCCRSIEGLVNAAAAGRGLCVSHLHSASYSVCVVRTETQSWGNLHQMRHPFQCVTGCMPHIQPACSLNCACSVNCVMTSMQRTAA